MARKAAIDLVEARLAAWTRAPVVGVNLQGETPEDGSPFLVVQYPVVTGARTTHGRTWRETGTIRFVLNGSRGAGVADATVWADELADLYRGWKKRAPAGTLECQAPTSPLLNDDNEQGMYFRLSVVVPYTFDFED